MTRMIVAVLFGAFGLVTLAGCHASGSVGETSSSTVVPR